LSQRLGKGLGQSRHEGKVLIDSSAVQATLDYLRVRSKANLDHLVSQPGNRLAYSHHLWSSPGEKQVIKTFWRKNLAHIEWSEKYDDRIISVQEYLKKRKQARWPREVLRYLPKGHVLRGNVYLIIGYDCIAFNDDVCLNLNYNQFHSDHREAVYYLIHESAHAGYYHYHPMPDLYLPKTLRELAHIVKYLTHLEGMGVFSSLGLRQAEHGLLDNDYRVLLDVKERTSRIRAYFRLLSKLERNSEKKVRPADFRIYHEMSRPKTRLWYIAGGFMAQRIHADFGDKVLRELVRDGCEAFFERYYTTKNAAVTRS
jgi:hypothetical protein